MRLKIWTLLLAFLLAAPVFAQYGGQPGITVPPSPSFANQTLLNPTLTGTIDATGGLFPGANAICFDGATPGTFKTCFSVEDPTGNRTLYLPNSSGVLLHSGAQTLAAGFTFTNVSGGDTGWLNLLGGNVYMAAQDGATNVLTQISALEYGGGITASDPITGTGNMTSSIAVQPASVGMDSRSSDNPAQTMSLSLDSEVAGAITLSGDDDGDGVGDVAFGKADSFDQMRLKPAVMGAGAFDATFTTADLTAARTITFPNATGNVTMNGQFNHAVVDSGGAGVATYSLVVDPGVSVATLDCLDADGCEVTLSETNAVPGQRLVILCTAATTGATTLKHSAGVVNLYNSVDRALAIGDAIEVVYIASTWSQIGNYDSAP